MCTLASHARYTAAAHEQLTVNAHHDGILVTTLETNVKLSGFFDMLSSNIDPNNGRAFVSTVEGKNGVPIMATQWHPEKNNFEWNQ